MTGWRQQERQEKLLLLQEIKYGITVTSLLFFVSVVLLCLPGGVWFTTGGFALCALITGASIVFLISEWRRVR